MIGTDRDETRHENINSYPDKERKHGQVEVGWSYSYPISSEDRDGVTRD